MGRQITRPEVTWHWQYSSGLDRSAPLLHTETAQTKRLAEVHHNGVLPSHQYTTLQSAPHSACNVGGGLYIVPLTQWLQLQPFPATILVAKLEENEKNADCVYWWCRCRLWIGIVQPSSVSVWGNIRNKKCSNVIIMFPALTVSTWTGWSPVKVGGRRLSLVRQHHCLSVCLSVCLSGATEGGREMQDVTLGNFTPSSPPTTEMPCCHNGSRCVLSTKTSSLFPPTPHTPLPPVWWHWRCILQSSSGGSSQAADGWLSGWCWPASLILPQQTIRNVKHSLFTFLSSLHLYWRHYHVYSEGLLERKKTTQFYHVKTFERFVCSNLLVWVRKESLRSIYIN